MIYVKDVATWSITGASGNANYAVPWPKNMRVGDCVCAFLAASIDTSLGYGFSWGYEIPLLGAGGGFSNIINATGFGNGTILIFGAGIVGSPREWRSQLVFTIDPVGGGDGSHTLALVVLGGVDAGAVDVASFFTSDPTAVSSVNAPSAVTSGSDRAVLHAAISQIATSHILPSTDSKIVQSVAGTGGTGRTITVGLQDAPSAGTVPAATITDAAAAAPRIMGSATIALQPKPLVPLYPLPVQRRSKDTAWKYFLARSSDKVRIGELARNHDKTTTWTLNRPGSLEFAYNMFDDWAEDIAVLKTCVLAFRDGVERWSGSVWSIDEGVPDDLIKVTCAGWMQRADSRLLSPAQELYASFNQLDAGQIGMGFLGFANAQGPTRIIEGQVERSQTRTRQYKRFQNIGSEQQQLSTIESGYDYEVVPSTREMNIWAKRSRDLTNEVAFGYKAGALHNLTSVRRQISGDKTVNGIYVVGKTSAVSPTRQDDLASQAEFDLMEEQIALSEVTDNQIALAYAAGELVYRAHPPTVYTISPMPWQASNPKRVPRPLENYEVGDVVSFSANRGRIKVFDQPARIFQLTLTATNEGNEEVASLQTALVGG